MFSDITPAKIGFIGLGLIGGSVAKAIRTYFPDYELIAFDKNKETLALAVQENIIDTSCSAIDDNFKGCSYIFLCAPVSYNTACLTQLKSLIDPDCILTDVGSVKTSIHEEIISLGMEENFIGGHPMAGSEKNGFANSKAHLIENAYYILTPSAKVSEEKINAYRNFVSSLKELPIVLDLFTDANPDAADKDFIECLNPGSLEVLTDCKVEAGLAAAADRYAESHEGGKTAPGYQFMRLGYFCLDNKDTKAGHPVFNRSVSLKDSFKK